MKNREPFILLFAAIYPTLLTLLYFVWLADSPGTFQKTTFLFGKAVQFSLPLLWVAFFCHEPWFLRRFSSGGVREAVGFGLLVFAATLVCHYVFLRFGPLSENANAVGAIRSKVDAFGIGQPPLFILFGLFYTLVHSGLEEYYWRWFVFRRLARHIDRRGAIFLSSVAFMAHHVVLLGSYFGYGHWLTWFGSLGVAIGGAYWSWSYHRFDSIWPAWISHGIIDAALFTVGFLVLFHFA